ncbi:MAG: 2-succinyl-5-enolpyruvyl-6-hydroxy-3-cyclohexene-1-carboxylic-acid synthase [Euryarchaeota archaeon]|nr:2-succinyl-5-enolpyruvyl-6-hydroxy-3-cyclohexene-1-carboxylic-acid synthase [Euryarchaeota archaeon]
MTKKATSNHRGASVLVAQLAESGLKHVVISPGSRNAPLTIAFDAHPGVRTHVVIDERAAAYYALGLGLRTGTPAAVVCTSGTAALNHGPAIAEAFHARVPLISITADRPTRVIERGHGQSVFQAGIFGKNCGHAVLIDELELGDAEIVVEAKKAFDTAAKGTSVHINVPFEEPLYGLEEVDLGLNLIKIGGSNKVRAGVPAELMVEGIRILVVAGALPFYRNEDGLELSLPGVCEKWSGIWGDAVVHSADMLMGRGELPEEPDVVITLGTPTLSKAFRKYLIEKRPNHYHVGQTFKGWDTWGSLVTTIDADPIEWLREFDGKHRCDEEFVRKWKELEKSVELDGVEWSDVVAFETILSGVGEGCSVHLSNSTSARYVQLVKSPRGLKYHCNRGVAGIDGCTSTAVGDAVGSGEEVVLITGDVAFLYDLNGLASVQEMPANLKVVVINNGGGEIFRWLDGPEGLGLVVKYFETKPRTRVKSAAEYCGLNYFCATNKDETLTAIEAMQASETVSILEVITDGPTSTEVYKTILKR